MCICVHCNILYWMHCALHRWSAVGKPGCLLVVSPDPDRCHMKVLSFPVSFRVFSVFKQIRNYLTTALILLFCVVTIISHKMQNYECIKYVHEGSSNCRIPLFWCFKNSPPNQEKLFFMKIIMLSGPAPTRVLGWLFSYLLLIFFNWLACPSFTYPHPRHWSVALALLLMIQTLQNYSSTKSSCPTVAPLPLLLMIRTADFSRLPLIGLRLIACVWWKLIMINWHHAIIMVRPFPFSLFQF